MGPVNGIGSSIILAIVIIVFGIILLLSNSEFGIFLIIIGAFWAVITAGLKMSRGFRRR